MALIRSDSSPVNLVNDGLVVFLYDDSNCQKITDAKPPILKSFNRLESLKDKTLEKLSRGGELAAYVLPQDEHVSLEVNVGPPLTADEMSFAKWLTPQKSFLRIPSGRLAIETYHSLRPGLEYPMERGATIQVPPGDYTLTLHRIDWEGSERGGIFPGSLPNEILTLTPSAPEGGLNDAPALLDFIPKKDLSWAGDYSVGDGVFRGKAIFNDFLDSFWVNIDHEAGKKLGLKEGSDLMVSPKIPELKIRAFLVDFSDPAALKDIRANLKAVKKSSPELATGWWGPSEPGGPTILRFIREKAVAPVSVFHQRRWLPVEVSLKK